MKNLQYSFLVKQDGAIVFTAKLIWKILMKTFTTVLVRVMYVKVRIKYEVNAKTTEYYTTKNVRYGQYG
jgi:hypothetical protein